MDAVKMFKRMVKKLESNRVIDQSTGCWLWTGSTRGGYGQLTYQSNNYSVHRLSAFVWLDIPLEGSIQVNHKPPCSNKLCFNPMHLYSGTQSQNILDIPRGDRFPCGHHRIEVNTYTYKKYKWCKLCRNKSRSRQRCQ